MNDAERDSRISHSIVAARVAIRPRNVSIQRRLPVMAKEPVEPKKPPPAEPAKPPPEEPVKTPPVEDPQPGHPDEDRPLTDPIPPDGDKPRMRSPRTK